MPRILGIDLPQDKPTHISLRYIRGIGAATSLELCAKAKVNPQRKARELNEEEVARLTGILDREYTVEGQPRRPPPQGPAGPRPAHPHQCPHPQGTAQNRRRKEGRQGNARLAARPGPCLLGIISVFLKEWTFAEPAGPGLQVGRGRFA